MSEKTKIENLKSKALRMAAVGTAVVGSLVAIEHFAVQPPQAGHDKVYITQPGDTEWTMAQRAYPNSDPRDVTSLIHSQESLQEQKDGILHPGDKIYFASDSQLGTEVTAGAVAASGR